MVPVGEHPPLPDELIGVLHERVARLRDADGTDSGPPDDSEPR